MQAAADSLTPGCIPTHEACRIIAVPFLQFNCPAAAAALRIASPSCPLFLLLRLLHTQTVLHMGFLGCVLLREAVTL
jgi:hypothetical protein